MTHPDFGSDKWTAYIEQRRLPCLAHPSGCAGIVSEPEPWPFTGTRETPCHSPRWCWCGELCEPRGEHMPCFIRRYAFAFMVCGLQDWLAPVNETWLRRRFRQTAEAVRFGPVGGSVVREQQRQAAWREIA